MRTSNAVDAQPTVSVIIPHYRDLEALAVCLETLRRQSYPASRVEIIVADNASPEGETVIARAIGDGPRLVIVSERGAGPARNGGAAVAMGDVFAFIDSDCQADTDWLAEGVTALEDFDFIGGRVRVLVDDPRKMSPAEAFEKVFAFDFETYITRQGFAGSGNLFCPRPVFEAVGGFLAGVSEDVEWSHRARARGFRLGYAPRAVVGHPARKTWSDLREKWRKTNLETYGLIRRRGGGRLRWLMRNFVVPLSAVAHTPRVLFSRELNTRGQRLSALAMLYWLRCWRLADAMRLTFAGERVPRGSEARTADTPASQML